MSGVINNDNKQSKNFKCRINEMENTIKALENNLKLSSDTENRLITTLQSDKIQNQGLSSQLEDARKENEQLLNILQQKCEEQDLSRPKSQVDLTPSCSTMSIVHLQYKYEELLANHHGLLKLLDVKSGEIKRLHEKNCKLEAEVDSLQCQTCQYKEKIVTLNEKYRKLKDRKNAKINKLKEQKETLQLVHNQLVGLLDNEWMQRDGMLLKEIRSSGSVKALLLQEVRKNNVLFYENVQLGQKIEYLKSTLKMKNKTPKKT